MIELLKRIKSCPDRGTLFDMLWHHFRAMGFGAFGYIVPSRQDPGKTVLDMRGFPADWQAIYEAEGLSKSDPFPQHVARHLRPLRLSKIEDETTLSTAEREFIERSRAAGVTDGFLIPTFGVHQHMGMFALGQVTDPGVLDTADLDEIEVIVQAAHTRLDQLETQSRAIRPRLAPREVEILHWIARGKTNAEIARIVGIGLPTVSTYIQRLFGKLEVTDRSAAAVKGLKYGIISI
ncbi:helix-turn-helix transcriptional regulator [Qipengyuania qiaonensis]|uniref:LuxR family transcriptional regulator n=1 Tax=Qipengyuania qiaonensis TaxID=2867240 RepID=A0ABS7J4F6_9SPHN|nr:LuxR family transcriptional regulator [Qipengyuania qiaonensis]MBX7480900.1 LuxR family transcriptional regulator [Qipengyuania qiaonensis]